MSKICSHRISVPVKSAYILIFIEAHKIDGNSLRYIFCKAVAVKRKNVVRNIAATSLLIIRIILVIVVAVLHEEKTESGLILL